MTRAPQAESFSWASYANHLISRGRLRSLVA